MIHANGISTSPCAGLGTWLGEAQRVRLLAAELGIDLDEESLVYYDVREVMALSLRLQRALRTNGGRRSQVPAVPVLWRLCASQDNPFPVRRS